MIAWHPTGVGDACTAHVTIRGAVVARLHARSTGWSVELLDGELRGPASSIGYAKRAAAEALAAELGTLQVELQSLLRA